MRLPLFIFSKYPRNISLKGISSNPIFCLSLTKNYILKMNLKNIDCQYIYKYFNIYSRNIS